MKIKQNLFTFDMVLLIYVVLLSIVGIVFAYSSNIRIVDVKIAQESSALRQVFFMLSGLLIMWGVSLINYKKFAEHAWIILALCVASLLWVAVFGKTVNNSKRWIDLGIFSIQPSEFAKVLMIVVVAHYLDLYRDKMKLFRYILGLFAVVMVPILIIFLQPDLGTSLVFIPVTLAMLFIGGVDLKYFTGILLAGFIATAIPIAVAYSSMMKAGDNMFIHIISNKGYVLLLAGFFLLTALLILAVNVSMRNLTLQWIMYYCLMFFSGLIAAVLVQSFMRQYQVERLLAFVDPHTDKWDVGYNVIQSGITVGSGGFFGKGLFNGTQGQLGFLPSRSTDFIFSVVGEELGFAGSAIIIGIYFLFLQRLIRIARDVKDYLGGLIVTGIITMFGIQAFINIGMTIGVAPVTGIPLPFITYGGSTMWTSLLAVGLVMSVEMRKYVH